MSFSLSTLPPELRENIWKHCSTTDLKNISCCSEQCCQLVRPFLWRSIEVDWKSLESRSLVRKKTRYLEYTSGLHFVCSRQRKLDCNLQNSMVSNLKYIFESCDMQLVSSVYISFQGPHLALQYKCMFESLVFDCLSLCQQLTKLSFREVPFPCIEKLVGLKSLDQLEIINCVDMTMDGIHHMLELGKLTKLTWANNLYSMTGFTDVLCKMVNVTELHLQGSLSLEREELDLIIQSLVNLEVLTLYASVYLKYKDPFHILATSLKHLRVLNIGTTSQTIMRDQWLYDISMVTSLQKFTIEGCLFVTNVLLLPPFLEELNICHCYGFDGDHVHIIAQHPTLRELTLCYCHNVNDVAELSVSPSLQVLNIFNCENIKEHTLCQLPAHITLRNIDKCTRPLYKVYDY